MESGLVAGEWGEKHGEGLLMGTGLLLGDDNARQALIMVMVAQLCDYI